MNDNNFRRRLMFTSLYTPKKLKSHVSIYNDYFGTKGEHTIDGKTYEYYSAITLSNQNNVDVIVDYYLEERVQEYICSNDFTKHIGDTNFTITMKAHSTLIVGYILYGNSFVGYGNSLIDTVKKA